MRDMKIRNILFDLDGTLVDTRLDYVQGVLALISASAQVRVKDMDEFAKSFWFGYDRDKIVREEGFDPDAFWLQWRKYDAPAVRVANTKAYEDISILGKLKGRGVKLGIVTSSPIETARMQLKRFGDGVFDSVVSCGHRDFLNLKAKPSAEGIYYAIGQLGGEVSESAMVGNGVEDIEMGRNAGIITVHINRGEFNYQGVDPNIRISSLTELEKLV